MSKEKEIETEFFERNTPEDAIKSSHSELQRSTEYAANKKGSEEPLYSLDQLKAIAEEWGEEAYNPIRSERSQKVCRTISLRATLECACILNNVDLMVECYRLMNEQALAA